MDLMNLAVQLLKEHMNLDVDSDTVSSALSGLLGDGDGGIDLGALSQKMMSSDVLSSVVSSWLGDGGNQGISADTIMSLLGEGNIADFAGKLGVGSGSAAEGLSDVLPQLMDKSSSGGSLLDSVGGLGGLMGAATSLFK